MRRTQNDPLPKSKRACRTDEVASAFAARYRDYQYRFVEFFIEHISDVSRGLKGDLQAMLVLAVIGQALLHGTRTAKEESLDPANLPPEKISINASRIADITGIPRETVRRKLALLEDWGWIRRNADGSCCLAFENGETIAKRDLAHIDARAIRRVARLFTDLEALLDEPGRPKR